MQTTRQSHCKQPEQERVIGTVVGKSGLEPEEDAVVLPAEITLMTCNPDCNPALENGSIWAPLESLQIHRV